ncbi:MAG: hypothetical protein JWP38_2313 [Herbaspirillum sp.]|jgi:hypothetical protein|nr:hypothetical protein [Herbaspirillum sp.]
MSSYGDKGTRTPNHSLKADVLLGCGLNSNVKRRRQVLHHSYLEMHFPRIHYCILGVWPTDTSKFCLPTQMRLSTYFEYS